MNHIFQITRAFFEEGEENCFLGVGFYSDSFSKDFLVTWGTTLVSLWSRTPLNKPGHTRTVNCSFCTLVLKV